MFSDTAKKSAISDAAVFSDAQKIWTHELAIGSSTFRDVTACSDAHKRDPPAGAHSLDKSVCSNAAAFSDAQINRTPLQAQETQAFRGIAASRRAQKRDAHSTCKPTPSDVAAFRRTQISCLPSHVIDVRAHEPAPS